MAERKALEAAHAALCKAGNLATALQAIAARIEDPLVASDKPEHGGMFEALLACIDGIERAVTPALEDVDEALRRSDKAVNDPAQPTRPAGTTTH